MEARSEIKKGELTSNEEVQNEIKKWLEK